MTMKTFTISIKRIITEFTDVDIFAESVEQAREIAASAASCIENGLTVTSRHNGTLHWKQTQCAAFVDDVERVWK